MRFLLLFLFLLPSALLAKEIPQELIKLGFTQYTLIGYEERGGKEYYTFSDWTTIESGDTITFVVENGKVKKWLKEPKNKVLDKDI